jgi:hypothetical protein
LVAGTLDVTLTNASGDNLGVLLSTSHGTAGVLSVKRKSNSQVTVESWQEPTSATGTLSSGTLSMSLTNATGDALAVYLSASHGTPGILSVRRSNNSTVIVESWIGGTGIQTNDISDVAVINFKQITNPDISDIKVTNFGAATNPDISDIKVVNYKQDTNPDTSSVKVYNFGQAAHETSTFRWAVIRP